MSVLPLEASLQGLREAAFLRTDHSPAPSTNDVTFANNFINQAVQRIALEHPYACHEDEVRFATVQPVEPIDATDTATLVSVDTVSSSPNPWVLKRDLNLDEVGALSDESFWPYDRSLDGAYIELTGPDGVRHTNQVRSIWVDISSSPSQEYLSLVHPVNLRARNTLFAVPTYGPFTWKIFQPYLWLPDDVVEIRTIRCMDELNPFPLDIIAQDQAETAGVADYNFVTGNGQPQWCFRRGHYQLPSPASAPTTMTATAAGLGTRKWRGPEPYGSFEYVYTLSWGKRDQDHGATGIATPFDEFLPFLEYEQSTDYDDPANNTSTIAASYWTWNRRREPLFESAPSPASATHTVADPGAGLTADAVVVQFPNIAYQLGFMMTGSVFSGGASALSKQSDMHSGIHIRLYRRRVTTQIGAGYASLGVTTSGYSIPSLHALDGTDAFYLLAEFKITDVNEARFVDNGFILPDYNRRLRNIHGYQGIQFHPLPDARYEMSARVIRRPPLLVEDTDVPNIHPEASQMIVDLTTALLYERYGAFAAADRAMNLYRTNSETFARRYADLRPEEQPMRRRPARANGYYGTGLRRWWSRSTSE